MTGCSLPGREQRDINDDYLVWSSDSHFASMRQKPLGAREH